VLSVSRLAREKNLDRVVRIAGRHPELRFLIVGDGPVAAELRRDAPPNLALAGLLEGADLADTYAAADVFLHPSTTETFGQVVQEAMAAGLPVVGIRAGGVGWLVDPGRTGVLVDAPGDGLGAALAALVRSRGLQAMGEAARRAVAGRSWTATMDALLADYAALAGAAAGERAAA
jgi:phosphatidylinositol alpha 1,6-mannosyltransferase